MKKIKWILLLVILLHGQVHARNKHNHITIFGRFMLNGHQPLVTHSVWLHFNERLWGRYAVRVDNEGYFTRTLPIGKNHVALLEYREAPDYFLNIADKHMEIDVPAGSTGTYYIGDISMDWPFTKKDVRSQAGVAGVLGESVVDGRRPKFTVIENEETVNRYKFLHPADTAHVTFMPMKSPEAQ